MLAKVNDWKSALFEKINSQSVQQRMLNPLTHLPKMAQEKNFHHVMEALKYWQVRNRSLLGEWALENPSDDNLQQELFTNLHWLAKHPRLITIGAYGNGKLVWDRLNLAQDPAQALGRAYGLLAASVVPFLGDDDTLLVAPALRSEDSSSEAIIRATLDNNSSQEREHGDTRGVISTLLDQSQRILRPWHLRQKIDSGVFLNLRNQYFKHIFLDRLALDNIADMGAALMTLSQNKKGDIRLIDQTWRNVKFFHFKELLS
ncbi:hypothetical protein THIOM_004492 [Candidatus Thiomargarita nelsonii]|uniref:Uncharacterized protein n=1 Tax=Candidatus Thiomargarita nelsonii TaxID=1003181 RepID=A0A176RVU2_9GAMM|nr:hypothetical protein THIOM_004492 [Candidatus Thiomargarita nelsonii]